MCAYLILGDHVMIQYVTKIITISIVLIFFIIVFFSKKREHNPYFFPDWHYPFELPKLSYQYHELQPYLDPQTLEIHYSKHHQGYVNKLNKTIEAHKDLRKTSLELLLRNLDFVPKNIRTAVKNFGGGHYNHAFFWALLKTPVPVVDNAIAGVSTNSVFPSNIVPGSLAKKIVQTFGGFNKFKEKFGQAALTCFGSGWTLLSLDKKNNLVIHSTQNQDTPFLHGLRPLLCIDLWEHAYYLMYQNRRQDFIDAWWHVLDWQKVEENYKRVLSF